MTPTDFERLLIYESAEEIAATITELTEWASEAHEPGELDMQPWVDSLGLEREQIYVGDDLYLNRYFLDPRYKIKAKDRGRVLIHHFVRGDYDRRPHNHPWDWAEAVILSGGYTEDRVRGFLDGEILMHYPTYRAGDINALTGMDYHRVHTVQPNTWTVFRHGPHVKHWGFIEAPPRMVNYRDYKGPST